MTVQEAIKTVKEALGELGQYRALGTVEGFKSALDSSAEYYNQMKEYKAKLQECEEKLVEYEAVGTITQIYEKIGGLDVELGKYHSLGTVEELKEAREKQVAKKPIFVDTRFRQRGKMYGECVTIDKCYKCPSCNTHIFHDYASQVYCEYCGQKLDWEEGGTSG